MKHAILLCNVQYFSMQRATLLWNVQYFYATCHTSMKHAILLWNVQYFYATCLMRFFTSQRPGLWILIVSCFFRVFFVFRFRGFFLFFLCFFPAVFPLLFHYLWMLSFVSPFVFFWLPCLVWCVATLLQPRFFTITTKHVCKAFLQEYRIRDIRFRVLWSPMQKGKMNTKEIGRKQDPNAEGKNDHEKNTKE